MKNRSARIVTHVDFEHEGVLAAVLHNFGFDLLRCRAVDEQWMHSSVLDDALWVVMGGPIGVYETVRYPFLTEELLQIAARLRSGNPVLGICLGAQLIAKAAGGRVFPGAQGKELGWFPLQPGSDVHAYPWFSPLLEEGLAVLHWHGDTFELPPGAAVLARTSRYAHQAFLLGDKVLGLQFHAEATEVDLEQWYIGHALELSTEGIDVCQLRQHSQQRCAAANRALMSVIAQWLYQCGF